MELNRPKLFCDSCGIHMEEAEDHGGDRVHNTYCKTSVMKQDI